MAPSAPLRPGGEEVAEEEARIPRDKMWFDKKRTNMLLAVMVLSGAVLYFIYAARSGKELFIRPIAGLSALDDAVGRE